MWPPSYRQFILRHGLVGAQVEIPEADDLSGVGASIEILDEGGAATEANDFYPGLVVKEDGFVPVGGCLLGSGDQYFINSRDEQPGQVYRIDHESVRDAGYDRGRAIERVLGSYEELLRYVNT
jgi:hypothetical protein